VAIRVAGARTVAILAALSAPINQVAMALEPRSTNTNPTTTNAVRTRVFAARFGVSEAARASAYVYSSRDDIDRLADSLAAPF